MADNSDGSGQDHEFNIPDPPKEPQDQYSKESAEQEARSLGLGTLEVDAKKSAHQRSEKFKHHVSNATIFVFWGVVLIASAVALCWVFHLVTPQSWHFLTESQLSRIESVGLGGAAVTILKVAQANLPTHN